MVFPKIAMLYISEKAKDIYILSLSEQNKFAKLSSSKRIIYSIKLSREIVVTCVQDSKKNQLNRT